MLCIPQSSSLQPLRASKKEKAPGSQDLTSGGNLRLRLADAIYRADFDTL